jgi:signal transduction histidine kinase
MGKSESNESPDAMADAQAAQLAALSRHLIQLAEVEKATLARQLHDELGACLTVISLDISIVAEKLKQTEPDLAARLQRAMGRIKEAVALKRRIVEELRPSMLDSLGLSSCLSEHVLEFEKRTGLPVTTDFCHDFDTLDSDRAIGIFRIAEESLRNIERHAGASRIWMSLQAEDGCACLSIEDDGVGIASDLMLKAESCGLIGMRERMVLHGGRLSVQRRDQGGTTVRAWLPSSPG